MDGVELTRVAPVEEGRAFVEARLHDRRSERIERLRLREERAPVERDDALEVRRLVGELAGERADEAVLVVAREQPVEAALEANRGHGLLAHPRAAAERPADVAGPDLGEVPEREEPLERPEEPAGALLGVDCEIRARDVAHEERVAGDDEPGLLAAAPVGDEIRGVLRPVAGGCKSRDGDLADRDRVAVGERLVLELDPCAGRHVDGGAGRLGQAALAGDVVGVVVRLEDVGDPEAVLLGELEVGLDVPFRVDDRRLAPVGDDVGRAPEILVQHLPEEHSRRDDTW